MPACLTNKILLIITNSVFINIQGTLKICEFSLKYKIYSTFDNTGRDIYIAVSFVFFPSVHCILRNMVTKKID